MLKQNIPIPLFLQSQNHSNLLPIVILTKWSNLSLSLSQTHQFWIEFQAPIAASKICKYTRLEAAYTQILTLTQRTDSDLHGKRELLETFPIIWIVNHHPPNLKRFHSTLYIYIYTLKTALSTTLSLPLHQPTRIYVTGQLVACTVSWLAHTFAARSYNR